MSGLERGGGEELRRLPSVERLARRAGGPHHLAVAAARAEIERARSSVLSGRGAPEQEELTAATALRAARLAHPSLRRVVNATGIVLHTNLGRAPLPRSAVDQLVAVAAGYSNLEYDLEAGGRGGRGAHIEGLLTGLGGAQAAIAVNNNAAAVMLALAALAGDGEVVVSRGELVEIGGSFRVPDILAQSGATLVEVGTTNRTRLADYEMAIGPATTAILRVHQSNFSIVGFTEAPAPADLTKLAHRHRLAMIDDLGSGALEEVQDEPIVRAAVASGADVVCCSGDKLLGGPQAGLLFGRADAIELCRRHPLARAVRLDKLQIAALEATLRAHRDGGREAIPALAMIDAGESELAARADRIAAAIGAAAAVGRESGAPGGGSLADVSLEGPVCEVDPGGLGADALLARLRGAEVPVVARIVRHRVVLDPRTMDDEEAVIAATAVRDALA
ncbi:MAG: L-seryl-tRNA(Sec) selenium transferase [Actinobacteria bacterium]|nr:L-seryl-tRNA(Sec) selenium transferase [Actinomycetota bacterium]MBS1884297.1 L-seryl-tRNA(Sec) selenium transferase [Actinomycetota bacterium]